MSVSSNRIDIIDSLRGLALFGILLTHVVTQFFGVMPEVNRDILNHNFTDSFITYSVSLLVGVKFFLVFAFLFGVSFGIQFQNSQTRDINFNFYYLKRMIILILFGLFNYCFFQGDILIVYGILSLLLLFIKTTKTKIMIFSSIFLFSGLPKVLIFLYQICFGDVAEFAQDFSSEAVFLSNFKAATTYSFTEIVNYNFDGWTKMISIFQLGYFGRSYQAVACFLLGVVAYRENFFSDLLERDFFKMKLFKYSIIMVIFTLTCLAYFYTINPKIDFSYFSAVLLVTIYDWFNVFFTIIITLFFLEYSKNRKFDRFYNLLKWPGRMSLTTYIMQSIFFTALYFNWGLALFNTHGASISFLIGILFFGAQCMFSFYWLKNFKQGPLETLWKKLTVY